MALKEITPPPVRTKDADLNKAMEQVIKALREIYRELKRLEKEKQNAG